MLASHILLAARSLWGQCGKPGTAIYKHCQTLSVWDPRHKETLEIVKIPLGKQKSIHGHGQLRENRAQDLKAKGKCH